MECDSEERHQGWREIGMSSPSKDRDVISTVAPPPSKTIESVKQDCSMPGLLGSIAWLGAWPVARGQWPRAREASW